MEVLPEFKLVRPTSLADMLEARTNYPDSALIGGGTDLMVNIRRGIVAPQVLIDTTRVGEMQTLRADENELDVGASVTLADLANDPHVCKHYPVVAEAALSVAGPTQRNMGTIGGNLCLDTRCLYYNQSVWWREANNHCLKTMGDVCHVAPKSRGVCFATFSGDLAPALLVLDAQIDIASPSGRRTMPLVDLYIGYARHGDTSAGDGENFLSLAAGEFVVAVNVSIVSGLRSAYDKVRIRRSIEYPVAGVAVALRRQGDTLADLRVAFTGTNPRPVLLTGTADLCGGQLSEDLLQSLDDLVRDQIMSMKTTFTPGHYRRRVASVLAQRLVRRLYEREDDK